VACPADDPQAKDRRRGHEEQKLRTARFGLNRAAAPGSSDRRPNAQPARASSRRSSLRKSTSKRGCAWSPTFPSLTFYLTAGEESAPLGNASRLRSENSARSK